MGKIGDLRIELMAFSKYVEDNICGIRSQINTLSHNIGVVQDNITNNKIKLSELPNDTSFSYV